MRLPGAFCTSARFTFLLPFFTPFSSFKAFQSDHIFFIWPPYLPGACFFGAMSFLSSLIPHMPNGAKTLCNVLKDRQVQRVLKSRKWVRNRDVIKWEINYTPGPSLRMLSPNFLVFNVCAASVVMLIRHNLSLTDWGQPSLHTEHEGNVLKDVSLKIQSVALIQYFHIKCVELFHVKMSEISTWEPR